MSSSKGNSNVFLSSNIWYAKMKCGIYMTKFNLSLISPKN